VSTQIKIGVADPKRLDLVSATPNQDQTHWIRIIMVDSLAPSLKTRIPNTNPNPRLQTALEIFVMTASVLCALLQAVFEVGGLLGNCNSIVCLVFVTCAGISAGRRLLVPCSERSPIGNQTKKNTNKKTKKRRKKTPRLTSSIWFDTCMPEFNSNKV